MGRLDRAGPGGHAGRTDLVDVEYLEGCTGPDHVHDAVDGTYLVEVHIVRWDPMETALDGSEGLEGVTYSPSHPVGEIGRIHHGQDLPGVDMAEIVAQLEGIPLRGPGKAAIPGTDVLTNVAAEDPVSDAGAARLGGRIDG